VTAGPPQFPTGAPAQAVRWREWSAEAFERALAEDRPVLLSISAVWCHWCHVMDETTYADPRVAEAIERGFVPVRVDADERPDIDARYNAGGWPTAAFLTPDGERIAATTYLRPEQLLDVLRRVQEGWLVNREGIARQVQEARAEREQALREATQGGPLHPGVLDAALEALDAAYDEQHGGFREAAEGDRADLKFPHAEALRLLVYAGRRRGVASASSRAHETLRRITESPLFDSTEGGFFRYATRPDWSEPHYEKLAGVQGSMLLALGDLALLDEEAREWALPVVEQTARYLADVLGEPSGGFRGSQDADPVYYEKDEEGRLAHGAPYVDRRVYADSTASAARGLMQCGIAFDRRDWVERGLRAVDFLLSRMRAGEAGMYHAWQGAPHGLGLLRDQVYPLLAALHAHEVSGRSWYLEQARALARALEYGWHDPKGGFWDVAGEHERRGLLAHRLKPLEENAAAAEAMLWLVRLTHDDRYLSVASEALGEFGASFAARGIEAAGYARVVDRLLSAEPEIKIVAESSPGEPEAISDPLHAAALRLPVASKTVQRLWRSGDSGLLEQLGLPGDRSRLAYVCIGRICSPPISDPDQLEPLVEEMVTAGSG
jgi:uncharacterized protein